MKTKTKTASTADLETVGQRLRHARETAGFSRRVLGEETEMSLRTIEHYENGTTDISLDKISTLAEALDVDLAWLISGSEHEEEFGGLSDDEEDIATIADALPTIPNAPAYVDELSGSLTKLVMLRDDGLSNHQREARAFIDDTGHGVPFASPKQQSTNIWRKRYAPPKKAPSNRQDQRKGKLVRPGWTGSL